MARVMERERERKERERENDTNEKYREDHLGVMLWSFGNDFWGHFD